MERHKKQSPQTVIILAELAFFLVFSGTFVPVAQAQSSYTFARDLVAGSRGGDVRSLQQFLNSQGARVSASGPGSPGNETAYFGKATKAALIAWQTTNGVTPSIGYFGPKSRAAVVKAENSFRYDETAPFKDVTFPEQAGPGLPIRFVIPKITVDTVVERTGLTTTGEMDIPKGPVNVAWFSLGPRPGENGSAVIAGHYGWKDGLPAVFDNLHTLQKGDKIYVEDEQGVMISFVVRESRTFMETDDASSVFISSDNAAHLNLVTCKGTWNKVSKSYSERLVVFTDKE